MKLTISVIVAVLVALGAGWIWGASGKSGVELERRALEARADFADARAFVLDGRVSLFLSNFGEAGKAFASARGILERAQVRVRETGRAERAGQLEVVLALLKDAQRLSAALDVSAQQAAEQALRVLTSLDDR